VAAATAADATAEATAAVADATAEATAAVADATAEAAASAISFYIILSPNFCKIRPKLL
jgi:hypothetical protein